MHLVSILALAGAALASSKPPRKHTNAKKAKVEARRVAANGDCAKVRLMCDDLTKRCHCHGVYKMKEGKKVKVDCQLKDQERLDLEGNVGKFESGQRFMCREKLPPCKKRPVKDLFGTCTESNRLDNDECLLDCEGSSCMPNYNGKRCMARPDVCKPFKSIAKRCDKYKRYTVASYIQRTCCRRCYRKTQNKPCLLGYLPKKPGKKQGPMEVATWDPEDRSMIDSKTKLCCRIKYLNREKIRNISFAATVQNPEWGPTPDGRLSESFLTANQCIEHNITCSGNGTCIPHRGGYHCSCDDGFTGADCSDENNMLSCPASLTEDMSGKLNHPICSVSPVCFPQDYTSAMANNHKFYYHDASQKWFIFSRGFISNHQTAKANCVAMGTVLGSIKSSAEQGFIEYLANEGLIVYDRNYRMGGERRNYGFMGNSSDAENMDWDWQDGSAVTWANWASGEPNNYMHSGGRNEPVIEMYTGSQNYKWNDIAEDNGNFYYICTRKCS